MDSVVATLESISPDAYTNAAARRRVKEAAWRLFTRMQTPWERSFEIADEQPVLFATIQTCMDLGIFEGWVNGDNGEKGLQELRGLCHKEIEANFLRRMLRCLGVFAVIEETGEDRWKPTPFSVALGDPESTCAQTFLAGTHHMLDAGRNFPEFLARTAYREPLDPANSNYKDMPAAHGLDFFARCQADPKYQASFISGIMKGLVEHKLNWTGVYDITRLASGLREDQTCFVDIGGGHGIDCVRMLTAQPKLPPGAVVLQDQSDVIEMARSKLDAKIRTMQHDFFTPQPIKGARAYFTHAVLHDWADDEAGRILQALSPAMAKGVSKLLLYENVIPPTEASKLQVTLDMSLMQALSSFERTEGMWQQLLETNGFKIIKIWRHAEAIESVIEAELA
ncbi:S-adenosyl-L-methionine-dependent methyltransferase [Xylariaceae sp. FL0016]|nr:S-adenosyl-L-methionine-dependent methyltransferase [Xylariaceae sp. FL0016]